MSELGEPIKFIDLKYEKIGITIRIDTDIVKERYPLTEEQQNMSEKERKKIENDNTALIFEHLSNAVFTCVNNLDVKEAQEKILEYITKFNINPEIKDVCIHKGQRFTIDPFSIVIIDNTNTECIMIIQCLKTRLTQDILNEYYKRMGGTDTTIAQEKEEVLEDNQK